MLRGLFHGRVYHSAATVRARGVLVGIANSVVWETEENVKDKEGRW